MIGLLQRVSRAAVSVDDAEIAAIGSGLLVLVGVERGDSSATSRRLLERLLNYRVFGDAGGKMNLSLRDVGGGLLLVPQFTLPADTRKGNRPSFTPAAPPADGEALFTELLAQAHTETAAAANSSNATAIATTIAVAAGRFGADMQVSLVNDGPVTFWLQVPAL